MKPLINFDDFSKLDLRVGEVVDVKDVTDSQKLLRLTVDFGAEIGQKTIFSGIKKWYTAASLINKKYIFIVNLEPKKFPFGESQGMILAIDTDKKPILLNVKKNITNGSAIS
jgi:methionyl-tRNA synthetase